MADAYSGTAALSNLVAAAVDKYVRASLRHTPTFRSIVDTRPTDVDKPGSSVSLYIQPDLADNITPLTELSDPDFVALGNPTPVSITLNEYGAATVATARVKNFSFSNIDPLQMDQVGWNMHSSIDTVVRNVASAGTNVAYGGTRTARNTVTSADVIVSDNVRKIVTKLRASAVQPRRGELYYCGIHPDVAYDLRREGGDNGWRAAHINAAPDLIWPAETGVYEGAFFVESARLIKAADGASSAPVYRTLFAGKEAIAEAVSIEPHVEIGVVPDKLNRFFPMGWYGLLGHSIFRQEAIWRLETGSSLNP